MTVAFVRSIAFLFMLFLLLTSPTSRAAEQEKKPADKPAATAETKCEHGVKQTICARCNPKLEPVFRAKNDWCEEHKRAESQCSICHPELKKKGIK